MKNKMPFFVYIGIFGFVSLFLTPNPGWANPSPKDFLVVAHPSISENDISVGMLRDIFQVRRTTWSNGSRMFPVNAPVSSELRKSFRREILHISEAEEETYWNNMQIRQGTTRPTEHSNPQRLVSKKPGAITYVFRSDFQPSDLKILMEIKWCEYLAPEKQGGLLVKVLEYDSSLKNRSLDGLHIGILYMSNDPNGHNNAQKIHSAIAGKKASGHTLSPVLLEAKSISDIKAQVDSGKLDAIYLSSGLEPWLREIGRLSIKNRILLFSGEADYLWKGASFGLVNKNNKAALLVNLEMAKSQGSMPDSRLLQLATLVRQ